jgi:lysozyme
VSFLDIVQAQLRADEGVRDKIYYDSLNIPSIGVGRNLRDVGLSPDEISYLFNNDVAKAVAAARALFSNFDELSDNRKAVLVSMAFNVGEQALGCFVKLKAAVEAGNFDQAAAEMLNSRWSTQVGRRADRLAQQMRLG